MKKTVSPKLKKPGRPNTDNKHRFSICLWIALGKSNRQIIDLLKERFDIDMSFQNIDKTFRAGRKWRPIIERLRNRYLENISRIPIARKAYRLAILQEAAEEALTYHVKSVNEWGTVEEKRIGIIPALVAEARAEVEGDYDKNKDKTEKLSFLQIIKVLSNGKVSTTIANRVTSGQEKTDGMDQPGSRNYQVL